MSDMRMPRPAPPHRALPSGGGRTVLGLAGPLAAPVRRPRPHLAEQALEIEGPIPIPGEYRPGTAGFRYWAVAEALERGAVLWRAAAEFPWAWAGGDRLRVQLTGGTEAVCEKGRLRLGAGAPQAAVMRALGHAVLDGVRPALWHVAAPEVAGLHAGFADAVAMLAALEVSGTADVVPQAATPFGRIFAEVLVVLAQAGPAMRRRPDPRLLALRGARLLADAIRRAPVAPDFAAQVAAEMALAATMREGPLVALQLRSLFARHGLLARSPMLEAYDPHLAEDGTELPLPTCTLPWVAIEAACFGLDLPLLLCPATQPPLVAPAADCPGPMAAAHGFTQDLFVNDMVEKPRIGRLQRRAPGTNAQATHLLLDDGRALRLVRERFVAG